MGHGASASRAHMCRTSNMSPLLYILVVSANKTVLVVSVASAVLAAAHVIALLQFNDGTSTWISWRI